MLTRSKRHKRWRHAALLCGLLCWPAFAQADEVRVYAAASLTDALGTLAQHYSKAHGVQIKPVFAASSTLAKQIDAGAPAAIFISADRQWMQYLIDRQRIAATAAHELLGNSLVLITAKGAAFPFRFDPAFDAGAAFDGRLCTGDVDVVPAGIYAKQALVTLGWWASLQKRIVGTDDVRAALAFVERGECAAGIVYRSDARNSDKVVIVGTFPDITHAPIVYPVALIGAPSATAQQFFDYLRTPAASATFTRFGFSVLRE